MEGQSIVLCAAAWLFAAPPPPGPAELLDRLIAAQKSNQDIARHYIWREDITRTSGAVQVGSETFDVRIVEGETYSRLVARDGAPLSPAEEAAENRRYEQALAFRRATPVEERRRLWIAAEGRRLRLNFSLIRDHHDLKLEGRADIAGRKAFVLATQPRRGAPKPKTPKDWGLCLDTRIWIDPDTWLPLRVEAVQRDSCLNYQKGTRSVFTWRQVDDAWLIDAILIDPPRSAHAVSTSQRYSDYRRFHAESLILFRML